MICDFKTSLRRVGRGERVEVFTDGNDDYTYVFPCFFKVKQLSYGQLVKIRDANGRFVRKEIRWFMVILTGMMWKRLMLRILTVFCGSEWVGWLERQCFSKKESRLRCALSVFQFYWDFISEI